VNFFFFCSTRYNKSKLIIICFY